MRIIEHKPTKKELLKEDSELYTIVLKDQMGFYDIMTCSRSSMLNRLDWCRDHLKDIWEKLQDLDYSYWSLRELIQLYRSRDKIITMQKSKEVHSI